MPRVSNETAPRLQDAIGKTLVNAATIRRKVPFKNKTTPRPKLLKKSLTHVLDTTEAFAADAASNVQKAGKL